METDNLQWHVIGNGVFIKFSVGVDKESGVLIFRGQNFAANEIIDVPTTLTKFLNDIGLGSEYSNGPKEGAS